MLSKNSIVFAQHGYAYYYNAAYDSSILSHNYAAAIKLLNIGRLTKGFDTADKTRFNYFEGYNYYNLNKIDSTIYYFTEALKIIDEIKDSYYLADINRTLGIIKIYYDNDYNSALLYFRKEKNSYSADADKDKLLKCYYNTGLAFVGLKNYDSALFYFKYVLAKSEAKDQLHNFIYLNIADIYSYLFNYKNAVVYYNRSINGLHLLKDSASLFKAYANLGDCYLQQKKYKQSISCFLQAKKYVVSELNFGQKEVLYSNFAEVYSKIGDFKKAFYYQTIEITLKDSVKLQDITMKTAKLETEYDVRKKQDSLLIGSQKLTISTIESSQRLRKLFISLWVLAAVALITIFAFVNVYIRQKANRLLTAQRNRVQHLASELEVANQTKARLFSTIGHDLRSPISSLYALLKMQEINGGGNTADAASMSSQTINLLDTLEDLLVWSKTQMDRFVPMPVLINIYGLYKELSDFFAGTSASKDVQIMNEAMPSLVLRCDENILRTMLRNAIGNAINHTAAGELVHLSAEKRATVLACSIKNPCSQSNFERFKSAFENAGVQSGSHGLGLVLIKEFAEKIQASVGLSYADGWVTIYILLPMDV